MAAGRRLLSAVAARAGRARPARGRSRTRRHHRRLCRTGSGQSGRGHRRPGRQRLDRRPRPRRARRRRHPDRARDGRYRRRGPLHGRGHDPAGHGGRSLHDRGDRPVRRSHVRRPPRRRSPDLRRPEWGAPGTRRRAAHDAVRGTSDPGPGGWSAGRCPGPRIRSRAAGGPRARRGRVRSCSCAGADDQPGPRSVRPTCPSIVR